MRLDRELPRRHKSAVNRLLPDNMTRDSMSTTYYLLRTKESAVGNGSYIGNDATGAPGMIASCENARRFDSLEAAGDFATETLDQFGGLEIEVRNSET